MGTELRENDGVRNLTGRQVTGNLRGMTLIEIMVVIAIISIMSAAIGYGVMNYLARAKIDIGKNQLRVIANALDIYSVEEDYPDSLSALAQGKNPLLKENQLKDPWKQDVIYNYPASKSDGTYDLCSKGPDRKEGTEDDICYE
jgi:general secretion pathway protein G